MSKLDEMRRHGGAAAAESIGRGVPAIGGLSGSVSGPSSARWNGVSKVKNAALIPLEKIGVDPDQPREEFEPGALGRLAESLKARGQLQPIRVRWDEGGGGVHDRLRGTPLAGRRPGRAQRAGVHRHGRPGRRRRIARLAARRESHA
jgi:ParB family chromosome partitioning protein